MTEATTVAEITNQKPATLLKAAEPKAIRHDSEKWLKFFLNNKQIAFMRKLREAAITAPIGTHASIDVGVVTGKNEFFVLSDEQVTALGLNGHTVPLVSRSVQLKGSRLRKANWKSLSAAGDRVHLLHISPAQGQRLSRKLRAYITGGERKEFHKGYKCSIRKPWFTVPAVWIPDGFAFRQIYDFPRMVLTGISILPAPDGTFIHPRAADPTKLSSSHNRPAPEAVTSAPADVQPTGAPYFQGIPQTPLHTCGLSSPGGLRSTRRASASRHWQRPDPP